MEKNIFEGAKFGDKFVTRDGTILLFQRKISDKQFFLVSEICIWSYDANGETGDYERNIVSRYKEPINEYKLDEYAHNYYKRLYDFANYMLVTESYKAGYHKAKEE